jgi:hypothetical protein
MLGQIKNANAAWLWMAVGKHPVARDYFKIGADDPLLGAFADRIESGYRRLTESGRQPGAGNGWRFWVRGGKKHRLLAGICRNSSDSVGRNYLLVVAGSGSLDGWEKHWDLLTLALESCWGRAEELAAKRFLDFAHLKETMRLIPTPSSDWSGWHGVLQDAAGQFQRTSERPPGAVDLGPALRSFSKQATAVVPIEDIAFGMESEHLAVLLARFKRNGAEMPLAVFLGGGSRGTELMLFRRPLAQEDFVRLWADET